MPSTSIIQALTNKLQAHKQSQFTGLVHISVGKVHQWSIYFHMGRMVWSQSRLHPTRRWHRQIAKHYPQLLRDFERKYEQADSKPYAELHYSKLVASVRKGELNRIDMAKAVEDYLAEILFDIVHQGTLRTLQSKASFTFIDVKKRFSSDLFLIIRSEQAWQQAQYDWQAWQLAGLVKCSPNLAPVIGQREELRKNSSEAIYQHLVSIIDGKQTFRDLSVQLNQPLLPLTRRIIPYIRKGLIGIVRADDLAIKPSAANDWTQPKAARSLKEKEASQPPHTKTRAEQKRADVEKTPTKHRSFALSTAEPVTSHAVPTHYLRTKVASNAPLIIYIDDSPTDSKIMGDILQDAGFRFRNIQESTHALPLLIEHKPQLIFLDLVMPVANGYEICSQVRRVSLFKDIPIVIVTSNNTLADRVHAKVVGASGFLSKPIQPEKVLKTVHRLLNDTASAVEANQSTASIKTSIAKAQVARSAQALKE